jgi:hypothetical protein
MSRYISVKIVRSAENHLPRSKPFKIINIHPVIDENLVLDTIAHGGVVSPLLDWLEEQDWLSLEEWHKLKTSEERRALGMAANIYNVAMSSTTLNNLHGRKLMVDDDITVMALVLPMASHLGECSIDDQVSFLVYTHPSCQSPDDFNALDIDLQRLLCECGLASQIAKNTNFLDIQKTLVKSDSWQLRMALADNRYLHSDLQMILAEDENDPVRAQLAANPALCSGVRKILLKDKEPEVPNSNAIAQEAEQEIALPGMIRVSRGINELAVWGYQDDTKDWTK